MSLRRRKEQAWEQLGALGWPEEIGAPVGTPISGEQTYADYLLSLGAVLLYDGTLTDDLTKIKNLGSLGAAADGTPTDITIDANGMNFNGSTSLLSVPALTGYNNLTTLTWMIDLNPAGAGEGNAGHILSTDTGTTRVWRINSASLPLRFFNEATGDGAVTADSVTANNFIVTSMRQLLFVTFDNAGDRTARIYKIPASGVLAEASYTTQSAMVGTITLPATALNIGNRAAQTFTLNGSSKGVAVFGSVLSAAQMNRIAQLGGLIS